VAEGVDRETALLVAPLSRLFQVPDIAAVARGTGRRVAQVRAAFARVDAELGLTAFELRLAGLVHQTEGRWERWQVRSLLDDTGDFRRDAVARSLLGEEAGGGTEADAESAIDAFLSERGGPRQRFDRLARQLDVRPGGEAISVATLATRALKNLLAG